MTDSRLKLLTATIAETVPFHDVDPAGVVWHGNYFRYFEKARCALLDRFDYSYRAMLKSGLIWPVVDISARFSAPIRFHQQIEVTATLDEWDYRFRISYVIHDLDGANLGRGETLQVPVSAESRELVLGTPRDVLARVEAAMVEASNER